MFSARTTMLLLTLIPALLGAAPAPNGDWPAWMGPDRIGVSHEKGLLPEWPKDGPKLLWKITDIGDG